MPGTCSSPTHTISLVPYLLPLVETSVVVLIERERKCGGDPGYVTRTDAVTISPVHRASLAAAASPLAYPRLT